MATVVAIDGLPGSPTMHRVILSVLVRSHFGHEIELVERGPNHA